MGEAARVASGSRQPEKSPTTTPATAENTPAEIEVGEQAIDR